jgi:predicted anti-sigma-YlaC factor YlaD
MNCATCREAVSARLDGEEPGVPAAAVDGHLRSCAGCRAHAEAADVLHRSLRVRAAEWGPDLTAPILARITAEGKPARSDRRRDLRVGLVVVALLQLVLAVPALLLGSDGGAPVHVARELGSFDAALAVGFLVAAWQPARAFGLLPVAAALVAFLAGTAVLDVAAGHAPAMAESHHLLHLVGLALVWLLTRAGVPDGPAGARRLAVGR